MEKLYSDFVDFVERCTKMTKIEEIYPKQKIIVSENPINVEELANFIYKAFLKIKPKKDSILLPINTKKNKKSNKIVDTTE